MIRKQKRNSKLSCIIDGIRRLVPVVINFFATQGAFQIEWNVLNP